MADGVDPNTVREYSSEDLLKLVDYAIAQILGGSQSYSIAGQQYTKADLGELRRWRRELIAEIDEDDGQSIGAADFQPIE